MIMESLGDPVWQIGGGIILLAALVLILALRSPEVHLAPQHQWFLTRLTLLVCFSCFLVLSAGVLLFHGANAASTATPAVTQPTSATASPHGGLSPTPVPSLAHPAFPFANAVSCPDPLASAGAHDILRCHQPARSEYGLGAVHKSPATETGNPSTLPGPHHDGSLPGGAGERYLGDRVPVSQDGRTQWLHRRH